MRKPQNGRPKADRRKADTGFPMGSCFAKELEHDADSDGSIAL
jgi:hypothetical protein